MSRTNSGYRAGLAPGVLRYRLPDPQKDASGWFVSFGRRILYLGQQPLCEPLELCAVGADVSPLRAWCSGCGRRACFGLRQPARFCSNTRASASAKVGMSWAQRVVVRPTLASPSVGYI